MKKHEKMQAIIGLIILVIILTVILVVLFAKIMPYTYQKDDDTDSAKNDVDTNIKVETNVKVDTNVDNISDLETDVNTDTDLDVNTDVNVDVETNVKVDTGTFIKNETGENSVGNPDRVTYNMEGFFYEPITEDVKERIYGLSYKEDCTVPYEDLNYVGVLYKNFDGETAHGEIICNKQIAEDLVEIFYELYQNEYPIEKIQLIDDFNADDDLSCAENNTSSFNYRVVDGTTKLSKHALGMAIDINPFCNPYVTYPNGVERISPAGSEPYADRDADLPYMIQKGDLLYNLFIERGFTWGGEWKTLKDYQHFQKELE